MLTMPWRPLYTIERSKQPEVTVYGTIAVVSVESAGAADLPAMVMSITFSGAALA